MSDTNTRVAYGYWSINECQAARHLHADGWTYSELALVLERNEKSVQHHVTGACNHSPITLFEDRLSPEEIRSNRIAQDMTQQELADEIGVSVPAVSNWQQGRHEPTTESLLALASVFECGDRNG